MEKSVTVKNILHPLRLQELAKQWLLEDTTTFDFAGVAAGQEFHYFQILFKDCGILAGIPFADAVFKEMGVQAKWIHNDGDYLEPITSIAFVYGKTNHVLIAERVVLNILSRASGVATVAFRFCKKLRESGWKGSLAGTRKTTPGFRTVEKYALLIGGADMHRCSLSDLVMIKDNHISISGSIAEAITKVRRCCGFSHKIEVECSSLLDGITAAEAGCDIVMFDNFKPEDLHSAAEKLKKAYPHIITEASGGITLNNILNYAGSCVDVISSSTLVQGYETIDISMSAVSKKDMHLVDKKYFLS